MNSELDRMLRASLEVPPPEWLDRQVAERVGTLVQRTAAREAAQAAARAERTRAARALRMALGKGWQLLRLRWLRVSWLWLRQKGVRPQPSGVVWRGSR